MRLTKKISIVLLLLVLMLMAGCSGPKAVTMGGTGDSDVMVSVGKVIPEKAEIGITGVGFNGPDKKEWAAGPYAMYLPTILAIEDNWQPFTGGAILIDGNGDFIPKIIGGVVYKPFDILSPVYFAEKAFPRGSVDSQNITDRGDDLYHWFALRYRFQ